MAVTPEPNQAFLREVDDELRRDRAEQFFRRYGRLVILAVGLFLAAAGGYLWWQSQREAAAGQKAETFDQAVADIAGGAATEAKGRAALEGLAKSSGGYGAVARLTLADAAMEKDDVKGAVKIWSEIASDESVAQPFRDLALVRQTTAEFDTLPLGTVKARLQGLAVPGNPWFGSAGELIAVAMLKAGDRAGAARIFAQLAQDRGVPETIRSRAVQMGGVLGVQAAGPAAPAAANDGVKAGQ